MRTYAERIFYVPSQKENRDSLCAVWWIKMMFTYLLLWKA